MGLFLLVGCTSTQKDPGPRAAPPSPTAAPRRGGEIVFGVLGAPATLDPHSPVASDLTVALVRPLLPSLFRFRPDGTIARDLVARAERTSDAVHIRLRRVRWSDGTAITAAHVARSIRRARSSGLDGVRAVRAASRRDLYLEVRGAWKRALARAPIVASKSPPPSTSAGPFRVTSLVAGKEIVYVRDPGWRGPGPFLDRMTVRFIQSVEIMLELLERGRLDAAALPSSVNLEERLDERGLEHDAASGGEFVVMDLSGAPDRGYRSAIVDAIRQRIMKEGLLRDDGRALPIDPRPTEDLDGVTFRLAAPTGDELLELVQRIIQIQLEEEDMTAQLVSIDPETLYGRWQRRSEVEVELERRLSFPGAPPFQSPDLASVPLFAVETVVAWRPGVHGVTANPTTDGPLWNAERWWREQ